MLSLTPLDTAKLRNAVALAEAARNGEVRYLGEIDNTEAATRKLAAQLAGKYERLAIWPGTRPVLIVSKEQFRC